MPANYAPHIRCSALGTLPGNEIFSFSVSMASDPEGNIAIPIYEPNNTVWNDLRDDFVTFWNASGCASNARLMSVKFAKIGQDGKYTDPPVERPVGVGGVGIPGPAGNLTTVPNQSALAVTLHTAADLGRVKGRFYLPMPAYAIGADGRIAESARDGLETAAASFVSNLNNQPGIDVLDLKVVVASQGRHNDDGSVKLPRGNHTVTSVSVGRTIDTIRSRRNKLTEFRGTPTAVTA